MNTDMSDTRQNRPATERPEEVSFASQLGPLLLLTTIFFLNFVGRIVFSPLLPAIESDLGIAHAEAGSFFLLTSAGYFISLLSSGFLSSRVHHRKAILVSALSVGVALIGISLCHHLWTIRFSVFLLGMAAGLYLPSGIATLTALIHPRHWGKAIAIHELAPNLGFVVAPLLAEAFMVWFSWRGVLVFLGVGYIIAAAAFYFFGRGGEYPGQ